MFDPRADLPRTVMRVLVIALLVAAPFWILRPFLGAIMWATVLSVATWPEMRRLEKWLWGRRSLSITVMTLAILAVIAVPFAALVVALVKSMEGIKLWLSNAPHHHLPPLPAWIGKLPLVGGKAQALWTSIAANGVPALTAKIEPHAYGAASWVAAKFGGLGAFVVQFLLTAALQAVMFARGEPAVAGVKAFARRLGGNHGEQAVELVGGTIRSVALGVVVTSLVQSAFSGVGLLIAGVPIAVVLTVVIFVLCVSQIGPAPLLAGVVIWCFYAKGAGWGAFMIVWSAVASLISEFLRPLLLKRAVHLPVLVTLAGVIGGLASLGLIGLFAGPVILSVTYTLLRAWVRDDPSVMSPPDDQVRAP